MTAIWNLKLVRGTIVDETRWWYRYVLRRRKRYVEEVIFSGPAPAGTTLTRRINGGDTLDIPGGFPA